MDIILMLIHTKLKSLSFQNFLIFLQMIKYHSSFRKVKKIHDLN